MHDATFSGVARAACPLDEGAQKLVAEWLAVEHRTREVARELGALAGRPGATESFVERCYQQFRARADLAQREMHELLDAWMPDPFTREH